MLKIATIVGRGQRSRSLQNLFASFFHTLTFSLTISKRDAILTEKNVSINKLLLGNLRTNRERVILPSRKNTLFIDQSAFSNFALYVIIDIIVIVIIIIIIIIIILEVEKILCTRII